MGPGNYHSVEFRTISINYRIIIHTLEQFKYSLTVLKIVKKKKKREREKVQ